jgi:hypothetical protein
MDSVRQFSWIQLVSFHGYFVFKMAIFIVFHGCSLIWLIFHWFFMIFFDQISSRPVTSVSQFSWIQLVSFHGFSQFSFTFFLVWILLIFWNFHWFSRKLIDCHKAWRILAVAGGPVAGGRWPVAGGRWPVAGGRWPVAGGRWPVAVGRWPVSRCPVAGGRWPAAGEPMSEMSEMSEMSAMS